MEINTETKLMFMFGPFLSVRLRTQPRTCVPPGGSLWWAHPFRWGRGPHWTAQTPRGPRWRPWQRPRSSQGPAEFLVQTRHSRRPPAGAQHASTQPGLPAPWGASSASPPRGTQAAPVFWTSASWSSAGPAGTSPTRRLPSWAQTGIFCTPSSTPEQQQTLPPSNSPRREAPAPRRPAPAAAPGRPPAVYAPRRAPPSSSLRQLQASSSRLALLCLPSLGRRGRAPPTAWPTGPPSSPVLPGWR